MEKRKTQERFKYRSLATYPVAAALLVCSTLFAHSFVAAASDPPPKTNSVVTVYLEHDRDSGLSMYADDQTRKLVTDFYTEIAGSETVAQAILNEASRYSVPLPLAFALAYVESRFDPDAVNRNLGSVDRGLFQLNSRAFPSLSAKRAFDPDTNAQIGLEHLHACLEQGSNVIVALAMYNAGSTGVRMGTPITTLNYISQIIDYEQHLSSQFQSKVMSAKNLQIIYSGQEVADASARH